MKRASAGIHQVAWMLVVVLGGCATLQAGGAEASEGLSCEDWNTRKFFAAASIEEVTTCVEAGDDPNVRGSHSHTPLHHASFSTDNPAIIARLVKTGACLSARDEYGQTPLHLAAGRHRHPHTTAEVTSPGEIPKGIKAARKAADANPEVMAELLRAGANPNARDERSRTPLHSAAADSSDPAVIVTLLEAGADIHARDQDGRTPLHSAGGYSHTPAIIALLVKSGADPDARDEYGETPLHWAAWTESSVNAEGITALVQAGADVDARNNEDQTPLHVAAAFSDNAAEITALLEAGADPNARAGFSRETPLYLAKKRTEPNPEVIAALEQAGAESPWIEIIFFKYVSLPIVTALAASAFRRWRRTARPTPSGQEPVQPV